MIKQRQVVVKFYLPELKDDDFLITSAIESNMSFISAGRICVINLPLAPYHNGRAL